MALLTLIDKLDCLEKNTKCPQELDFTILEKYPKVGKEVGLLPRTFSYWLNGEKPPHSASVL